MMEVTIRPGKLSGSIAAIPSKSAAHRYLICAALADKVSRLRLSASSEDIDATISCLRALGAEIKADGDVLSVLPIKNTPRDPLLLCGESGSTLRFLAPVVCALGGGTFKMKGRLPDRPMDELNRALISGGVAVDKTRDTISYRGKLKGGEFSIPGNVSSQYVTGLLLALPLCGGGKVTLTSSLESAPYVDVTLEAMSRFGIDVVKDGDSFTVGDGASYRSADVCVPGDWSNAAFWLSCGVGVTGLDPESPQGDKEILEILSRMGAGVDVSRGEVKADIVSLRGIELDAKEIPDLVPVVSVLCGIASGRSVIRNISRLRAKESDRVGSVCEMLGALGAETKTDDDSITIIGRAGKLRGGRVDSHNDHRIAMAAAVAANYAESPVTVAGAEAVGKSYPGFWDDHKKLGGAADVEHDR